MSALACGSYDSGRLPRSPATGDAGQPVDGSDAGLGPTDDAGQSCGAPDDPDNCGRCGNVCTAGNGGDDRTDNGCETSLGTLEHGGGCGVLRRRTRRRLLD